MAVPKVFSLFGTKSYEEMFPTVSTLGAKTDFFLECSSYDMILKVRTHSESRLDIFEEAVLKLIAYKSIGVEEMAETLCLTSDLVNFIVIRLKEMNLLSESGWELTDMGRQYINAAQSDSDRENMESIHAKLFVLSQTGEILPFVQKGEFRSEPSDYDERGRWLTVKYGTAGKSYAIRGKVFGHDASVRSKPLLQNSEIKDALKKYNRIVKGNPLYDPIEYAEDWAVENTLSERVCFHMQAAIQDGNVDEILVSDGFAINIDFVNGYIKKYYPNFISIVKERATQNKLSNNIGEYGNMAESDQMRTSYRSAKYRELTKLYRNLTENKELYSESDESDEPSYKKDEIQKLEADQKAFLLNCYSAFEWCLYYYDRKNPISEYMTDTISSQNAYHNSETVMHMASKIGITHAERYRALFNAFDSKRINRMFKTDTPELRTVLSLAVISAADNAQSGFRRLFKAKPGMFEIFEKLQRKHGDLAHQTITQDIDKSFNRELFRLLVDCIGYLLPDCELPENAEVSRIKSSVSQDRLNAEVSLSKNLGAMYFYSLMPEAVKNEWILVSPNKTEYPEPAEYVNILYRIMQDTLYYALKDIGKTPSVSKNDILDKLKQRGIASTAFENVAEEYVSRILQNENATLGANAMAYLFYQNDESTKELLEKDFVGVIEKLTSLRKHGNNIVMLNTDTKMLNELRDKMLILAKAIGGN